MRGNGSKAGNQILSLPEARWPWRDGQESTLDFRKLMAWFFLVTSVQYVIISIQTIRFMIRQHVALTLHYDIFIRAPIFSLVVVAICGVAWWKIWRGSSWARSWGIAASLAYISIFVRPFLTPLKPVFGRHIGALVLGMVGLFLFLRRGTLGGTQPAP